jgi:hypothetical protein
MEVSYRPSHGNRNACRLLREEVRITHFEKRFTAHVHRAHR